MAKPAWYKLKLLLWKNWLIQVRHKYQTIVEILVPVVFAALLIYVRTLVDPVIEDKPTHYVPLPINILPTEVPKYKISEFYKVLEKRKLNYAKIVIFTPMGSDLQRIMSEFGKKLGLETKGVSSVEELELLVPALNSIAGIVFGNNMNTSTTFDGITVHGRIIYTIRFPSELRMYPNNPAIFNWVTDLLYPQFPAAGPRAPIEPSGGSPPGYYMEGFLALQHTIAAILINEMCHKYKETCMIDDMLIQRFSYPPYTQDILLSGLELILSLIFLLSYVYTCINTVKFVTAEKEKQLKETMKIMGLDCWLHWVAWFVRSMILLCISNILVILLLKISWFPNSKVSVFTYSSATALFTFFTLYSMAIITYCFMISVFFSKANTASSVSGLVWFIFYFPYMLTERKYAEIGYFTKIFLCFFQNSAMGFHFKMIIVLEGKTDGLQWNNIFKPGLAKDSFSIGSIWIMLIFDSFVYMLIALYFEKVMPGDIGVAEKWNFIFKKEFWKTNKVTEYIDDETMDYSKIRNIEYMESEPENKYAGVQIKKLRKVFGSKKVVVQELTMNMYEDQITVLLGHNGAGKTTTMSMLSGIFPPTSGTAIINGKDLRTDLNGVRESLGLCPQYNVLFDELTVREHIIFFSKLKGVANSLIEGEVTKYVNLLDLQNKTHAQSATLSGGMKRKLSMAVALCGGSKVVLCDEPSSGMDPSARRALWDVFQQEKKGRTILLSTHFMDEADILGDRIAIMSAGDLKCCGSSFYLKKKFGVGYHLICVKTEKCRTDALEKLLKKYVSNLKPESNIGSELSYQLSEKYVHNFPKMLMALEEHQIRLGISSYGLSLTTLEEVFMRVGIDVSDDVVDNNIFAEDTSSSSGSVNAEYLLNGVQLSINQIESMFLKKIFYASKSWILLLIQNLIPFVFILLAYIVVHAFLSSIELPPLTISLKSYPKTVTTIQLDKSLKNTSFEYRFVKNYIKLIKKMPSYITYELTNDDISDYIYGIQTSSISKANEEYLIGFQMTSSKVIAFFNNQAYHTAPLTLLMAYQAAFRTLPNKHQITVINHPLPYTEASRLLILKSGSNFGFIFATNLGFAMSFVSAFYVLFYIKERESRSKLLQFISGINVCTFWITAFIWDLLTFTITCVVICFTLFIFQEDGYKTANEIGRCFILLFLFGWAMLPLHYLASMFFSIPSTGFTRMAMLNVLTGVTFFLIAFVLDMEIFDTKSVASTMTDVGVFFPHFSLTQGINNLNLMSSYIIMCNDACNLVNFSCTSDILCNNFKKSFCCDLDFYKWSPPGILRNLVYLFFIGLILFIFVLIKDNLFFEFVMHLMKKLYESKEPPKRDDHLIDSDVRAENLKVEEMEQSEIVKYNLVVKNMSKCYSKFVAVNNISFAVNHSECFGLLGINGAGKTTTFKMLTGDEKLSSGDAWVTGISLKSNIKRIYREIGYCPQFDALIEDLTGRETLRIFCLLRGIPRNKIKDVSMFLAFELNFLKHINKRVKEYSGGNKRKLSTALALIGTPSVVYLDEPTTGMDPGSKRHLWNFIINVRNMGQTVLLTTHYMEECEALCTRMTIMVNGKFKCIGSSQHLKNKFSQGLTLTIKAIKPIEPNSETGDIYEAQKKIVSSIKEYMSVHFIEAILKEEFQGVLTYFISGTVKWSTMFSIMEKAKSTLQIEDYAIVQTSLEQVFLSFAQRQNAKNPIRKSLLVKFAEK